jgi:hypothetical protein
LEYHGVYCVPILCMQKQNTYHHQARLDSGEHAATALYFIARFGWLRATELGRFIYLNDIYSRKYAEKLLRKLVALRYVVPRKLPGSGAGTAFVLSSRGADWLNAHSTEKDEDYYKEGTNWGRAENGGWMPPASWMHDLIVAGIMSILPEKGAKRVFSELELRRMVPNATKHPDGIFIIKDKNDEEQGVWLEVERSRKTGKNAEMTIMAVLKAQRGIPVTKYPELSPITHGIIAIPNQIIDERGYTINHKERIINKAKQIKLSSPITLQIMIINMRGVTVESIKLELVKLEP